MQSLFQLNRLWKLCLTGLLVCALVISSSLPGLSQTLSFSDPTSPGSPDLLPSGVTRYGSLELFWVDSPLSGKPLFQVASPKANRTNPDLNQVPVEVRARNIEDLLRLEVNRFRENALTRLKSRMTFNRAVQLDPAQVIISTLRSLTVVQVKNAENSRPLTIATVTEADIDFYSEEPEQVAQTWKAALEADIQQAQFLYSPETFSRRIQQSLCILLGVLLLSLGLGLLCWRLARREAALKHRYNELAEIFESEQALAEQQKAAGDAMESARQAELKDQPGEDQPRQGISSSVTAAPVEVQQTQRALKQERRMEKRISFYKLMQWLTFWLIILVWYAGAYFITTRLPILMQWSDEVLTQPLNVITIWFVVSLLLRVSNSLIQRSVNAWKDNPYLTFGDARRKALRSKTVAGALQGLVFCILLLLGLLTTLARFGFPAPSILAGSAVFGLALSFGAQSLVKDLVNGCLILLEDQFAVGDIIATNGESGLVEKLNLRLTQLRNADGELITIPNSQITLVKNKTSSWSRVNLGIEVAYDTDLEQAIAVIDQVAIQLSQDENWRSFILDKPQVLGVDSFGNNSITIRCWIQTEPLQQFNVAREFRLRLKKVFDREGIAIPFPQQAIWFKNALPASQNLSE